jgi:SAM-dependent methyltransferase
MFNQREVFKDDPDELERIAELDFRSLFYHRINQRRLEHLASLGLDLCNKRVLELGAGVGDHTTFFTDRGCSVVSVEPRAENCRIFRRTMHAFGIASPHPVSLLEASVEQAETIVKERFDIIHAYGLLYHLDDPERRLRFMAERCDGLLLLETCTSFGDLQSINIVAEQGPSQAISGFGCRPTRPWVWNQLKVSFEHVYVTATQPAHAEFPLDWGAQWPPDRLSRSVFVASRTPIENPRLLTELPRRQTIE